jgi:hypothetical protein
MVLNTGGQRRDSVSTRSAAFDGSCNHYWIKQDVVLRVTLHECISGNGLWDGSVAEQDSKSTPTSRSTKVSLSSSAETHQVSILVSLSCPPV